MSRLRQRQHRRTIFPQPEPPAMEKGPVSVETGPLP
jgi:hypothetical protein